MATQVKYARANFEHLHTTGVQFSKDAVVHDALQPTVASKASVKYISKTPFLLFYRIHDIILTKRGHCAIIFRP